MLGVRGWLSWLSIGLKIQRPEVRTLSASGAQEKFVSFSESRMLCGLAVVVPNSHVCIRTHKNDHTSTLVHVTVWLIMET